MRAANIQQIISHIGSAEKVQQVQQQHSDFQQRYFSIVQQEQSVVRRSTVNDPDESTWKRVDPDRERFRRYRGSGKKKGDKDEEEDHHEEGGAKELGFGTKIDVTV